jgi:hypothetical protein
MVVHLCSEQCLFENGSSGVILSCEIFRRIQYVLDVLVDVLECTCRCTTILSFYE